MFEDNITAQGLYNDLHFLEQYLDNISREVKTPYIDRKGEQIVAHGDSIDQEILFEVIKKESQLKLLVEFIGLFMDNTNDKMQNQADTIDRLENDIKEIAEDRASTNMELNILKQNYESLHGKHREMESSFQELEEKYDIEKLSSDKKTMEIKALSAIKDKYAEVKDEEKRKAVMNLELCGEKAIMETQIGVQREENSRLKEELKMREIDLADLRKSLDYISKAKCQYERQAKDYDSEREACISEIQNLRAQLEEANSKCESIEQELTLARHPSNNTVSVKEEIPESVLDNLNLKMSQVISQYPLRRLRSKSNARNSFSYPIESMDEKSSPFRNFVNVDDLHMDQYDNIRFSVTREDLRDFQSYGVRKSNFPRQESATLPGPHVKEDRTYQSSWDSNASTEAPGKIEKNTTEATTAKGSVAQVNSATSAPVKEKQKLAPAAGKRKDILEEFYQLTWQSVLLNSQNFNDIAGWVDSANIYEEINKKGIPFFQWYTWLDSKLQEVYKSHLLPEIRERRATAIISRRQTKG